MYMNNKTPDERPHFLSPSACTVLLHTAATQAFEVLPIILLRLFAGLREAEALESRWDDLDPDSNTLLVPGLKSSVSRVVPVSRNLAAWLLPLLSFTGRFYNGSQSVLRSEILRVFRLAQIDSRPNVLRRSFALYYLTREQNLLHVGHVLGVQPRSGALPLRLPSKVEVDAFWNINPPSADLQS